MSALVTKLREQRLNTWEQAKAVAEAAAEEKRSMTGEEERQWDEANNELTKLDERISSLLKGEQRDKDAAAAIEELESRKVDSRVAPNAVPEIDYNVVRRAVVPVSARHQHHSADQPDRVLHVLGREPGRAACDRIRHREVDR